MRFKMWVISGTLWAVVALANPAMPGELKPSHIASDANWLAHLDLEAGADFRIFDQLTTEGEQGEPSRLSEWFSKRYAIEPEDLDGLTVYALGGEQEHTVTLLYGQIDNEKLLDVVRRYADVSKSESGGTEFYSWTLNDEQSNAGTQRQSDDPNEPRTNSAIRASGFPRPEAAAEREDKKETNVVAAFLDEVAIFANSHGVARQAVSAIESGEGLTGSDKLRFDRDVPGKVFLNAALLNTDHASGRFRPHQTRGESSVWAVLSELDTFAVSIGETKDEKALVTVEAKAKSEHAAKDVGDILDGLRALASLSANDTADTSEFNFDSVKPDVDQQGEFLQMEWTLDIDRVAEMIGRQLEQTTPERSPVQVDDSKRPTQRAPQSNIDG